VFLVMQLSPAPCNFNSSRSKYSPQHPTMPSAYVPPLTSQTTFHTHTEQQSKLSLPYYHLCFLTADEETNGSEPAGSKHPLSISS
jgi:hypothetical protein